jgi:hypothetical protein
MGPAAKKFIDKVEMSEVARKAAASKIVRAIGIEVIMATLLQELRNEEQFSPGGFWKASLDGRRRLPVSSGWCFWAHLRWLVCRLFVRMKPKISNVLKSTTDRKPLSGKTRTCRCTLVRTRVQ